MSIVNQGPCKTEGCVAIIGMSGRFPGASNIGEFWQNLRDGVDSVCSFSDRELEASGVHPSHFQNPAYVKAGAILEDIGMFDAEFFDITAREAACLDPQHRLLLECAWEALEHAGYFPHSDHGTIGVYAGARLSEYLIVNLPAPDMVGLDPNSGPLVSNWKRVLDNDKGTLATRIAYKLDLKGPAIAMQTACSTSLVAVHMACQSLIRKDCDIMLAGGVCVRVPQKAGYLYSEGLIFSPDGHTRAFDAKGQGTIFSSGVGMVALKRLDQALADGDCIQAVIKGSAINNDGDAHKAAFTSPSVAGQVEVVRKALAVAEVNPETITYVEAHGTATAHGDLTEMSSLTKAFRSGTDKKTYCALGSVKTNIGHPTQASGVIGLIKTVLMLKHKKLVPHLHFETPNPQLDFTNSPFFVNTELTDWNSCHSPRRAGVNAFGVGGTNAHVILEEAPPIDCHTAVMNRPVHILCLSAKTQPALMDLVERYDRFFKANPKRSLEDICFTANTGRSHFIHRLAVVADSSAAVQKNLAALAHEDFSEVETRGSKSPRLVFLFSGQGSQYLNMGRQLFETHPLFRETLERCDRLLRSYLEKPLLSVLFQDTHSVTDLQKSNLDETLYTQTALFAIEYSLYELWASWGVVPDIVMGHSIGELVAACVAGVFSLEDGLRLVAERGRLMQVMPGQGAMAAVFTDSVTVTQAMQPYVDDLSIAAMNGPANTVVSGPLESIEAILRDFEHEGIKARRLAVSHAFHSRCVESIMDSFENTASEIHYASPRISLLSNVTGRLVEGMGVSSPGYWRHHLRAPVLFAKAMNTLSELGCRNFVEVGPGSTLLSMGRLCTHSSEGCWLPSLKQGQEEWQRLLQSLGNLYTTGIPINWAGFDAHYPRRRVELPTYPFQRKRYWIDRKPQKDRPSRFVQPSATAHPLLGRPLPSALKDIQFESVLSIDSTIYLQDHHVYGTVLFPATGYIEMVQASIAELYLEKGCYGIENLEILAPLTLPQEGDMLVQLALTPGEGSGYIFQIHSLPADQADTRSSWKCHVTGKLVAGPVRPCLPVRSLESFQEKCDTKLSVEKFYFKSQDHGVAHGPTFQPIRGLWQGKGESIAQILLGDDLASDMGAYQAHPVLMDACLHAGKAAFPSYRDDSIHEELYLPTIFERVQIYDKLEASLWSCAIVRHRDNAGPELRSIDLYIFNRDGRLVAEVQGLHFKRAGHDSLLKLSAEASIDNWLYEVKWCPKPSPSTTRATRTPPGKWLVFTDGRVVGSGLEERLREYDQTCISICPGDLGICHENPSLHVRPGCLQDFHKLLSHIKTLPGPLRGVVHLWGLDTSSSEDSALGSLMETQMRSCASALHLIQALVQDEAELPSLWFVTRGAQSLLPEDSVLAMEQSTVWGLARVAAREHPKLHCAMVDLDPAAPPDEASMLFKELWTPDNENQVGFRQQQRFVSRLHQIPAPSHSETRLELPAAPCFRLEPSSGVLNELSFQPIARKEPGPGEIEIRVKATGLNFRDVLSALGKYPGNPGPLGRECAGTVSAVGEGVEGLAYGDHVLAIAAGSFSNYVVTPAQFAVLKPDILSFEDAATIPITFLTAYYGLYHLAKLKAGERVLIHAASGGVGLAAAQLVEWAGAEVFATASLGKWEFLKSRGFKHIMNSRTLAFAKEVMSLTNGQGVDVVINSLADEFIPKSISVLGQKGRFIEIGKSGIWNKQQVADLRPDVSYFPFDLGTVAHADPEFFHSLFQDLMKGFTNGALRPLPQKRFPMVDSIKAFRYMAQAKHIGKIVVHQPDQGKTVSTNIRGQSAYLITGGLGALGLQIARWLVAQNASTLILVGRNGPSNEASEVIDQLTKGGATIHAVRADVSNRAQLANVLENIKASMPPLRGIIHAAGVLDDGVLLQQTWDRFANVMKSKVTGAWNLHELTQDLPLDFFVMFSSVSSLWGTPGQSNYAAANAFLDGLAHFRHARRLPSCSINWGSWAEVGMAADLDIAIQHRKKARGLGVIDLPRGLDVLGRLIGEEFPQVGVINVEWGHYIEQFSATTIPPFFSEVLKEKRPSPGRGFQATQSDLLLQIMKIPVHERPQAVSSFVKAETLKLLGLDPDHLLSPQSRFVDLGLDSLGAIELRNALEASIKCTLPATLLYDCPTIEEAANHIEAKLNLDNSTSEIVPHEAEGLSATTRNPPIKAKARGDLQRVDFPQIRLLNSMGSKPPLILLHTAPLAIHAGLGPDQPVYFFRGLWQEEDLPTEVYVKQTATNFISQLKTIQPSGPYYLAGGSMGGLLALEMAQQLNRQGEEIALLFLIEPETPIQFDPGSTIRRSFQNRRRWMKSFTKKANRILWPSPAVFGKDPISLLEKLSKSRWFTHTFPGRIMMFKLQQAVIDSQLPMPGELRDGYVSHLYGIAMWHYHAQPYPGGIIVHKVKNDSSVDQLVWAQLARGGIDITEMDLSGHLTIFTKDHESVWINALKKSLSAAQLRCPGA